MAIEALSGHAGITVLLLFKYHKVLEAIKKAGMKDLEILRYIKRLFSGSSKGGYAMELVVEAQGMIASSYVPHEPTELPLFQYSLGD